MTIAPKTLLACATACVLVAAGCGGSDDESEPAKPAASTPSQTTETTNAPAPAKPRTPAAVAPTKERLDKAGYDVIVSGTDGVDPPPEGALEFPLDGGGQITVFVYAKPADARARAAEFEELAKQYPDRAKVVVVGSTAYVGTAEEPEKLDIAGFDEAVARAEKK